MSTGSGQVQSGVFTRVLPNANVDLLQHLTDTNAMSLIRKYELAAVDIFLVLSELLRMNISHGTLFPDAAGAAKAANSNHIIEFAGQLAVSFSNSRVFQTGLQSLVPPAFDTTKTD